MESGAATGLSAVRNQLRLATNWHWPNIDAFLAIVVGFATLACYAALDEGRLEALAVLSLLAPVPLLVYSVRVSRDLLDLGVLLAGALFLYFGIRPLVVLTGGDPLLNPLVDTASNGSKADGLVMGIAGCLAAWVGYMAVREGLRGLRQRRGGDVLTPSISGRIAAALLIIGLPALVLQAAASQAGLDGRESDLGSTSGLLNVAAVVPFYGFALLGLLLPSGNRRVHVAWALSLVLLLSVGVVSLFKETIVLTVLCAIVPLHYLVRPIRFREGLALILAFTLVVVPAVGALREARSGDASKIGALGELPARLMTHDLRTGKLDDTPATAAPWRYVLQATNLTSRRLSGTDSVIAVTRRTPVPLEYERGHTLVPLAAGPVPRFLWPSKPKTGLGRWFTERYWAPGTKNTSAQPITVVGEGYVNFGFVGVIGLLVILAGVWAALAVVLNPSAGGLVLLAYPFVVAAALAVERNLAYTMVNLGQRVAPLVLLWPAIVLLERRRASTACA